MTPTELSHKVDDAAYAVFVLKHYPLADFRALDEVEQLLRREARRIKERAMTLREKSVDNEMFDSAIRWVQQIQDQLPPTLKGEAALIAGKLGQLREKVLRVPVQEDAA